MATGRLPTDLRVMLHEAGCRGTASFVRVAADRTVETLSAGALRQAAVQGAEVLLNAVQISPGGTRLVLLVVEDPLAFVRAFFTAVQAGLTPVPLPGSPHVHARHLQRLRAVLQSCDLAAVLTDCPDATVAHALREFGHHLPILRPTTAVTQEDCATYFPEALELIDPATAAYVQYTSGSLSSPKPVHLTHSNVVAQLDQAASAFEESSESTTVNWVPLHHDMGLVTSVLRPLWSGYRSVIIDPFDFVRDPALWLRELTRWGASHTSSPNFGYELAARKAGGIADLDLSSLRVARCAGEPVRAATLDAFTAAFDGVGFKRSAFNPSYGMAEATLTVTASPIETEPVVLDVDLAALRQGLVEEAIPSARRARLVSSGTPLRETRVAVIDTSGVELPSNVVGEVWISGPQVSVLAQGAHEVGMVDGYRTGDMGFIHNNGLYLLGRAKERFQIAAENYYSVEVEAVATTADSRLRPGRGICVVAQSVGEMYPTPTLLLELREEAHIDEAAARDIVRNVTAAVSHEVGLPVRAVGILRSGTLPRTTSGKLQRELGRVALESGQLELIHWHQRGNR